MTFISSLCSYHEANPDPLRAGCSNTGEHTDGVSFTNIDPTEGSVCFVGRPSLLEAVGVTFGLTPDQVTERLTDDSKPAVQIKELKAEIKVLQAELASWAPLADAIGNSGRFVPAL